MPRSRRRPRPEAKTSSTSLAKRSRPLPWPLRERTGSAGETEAVGARLAAALLPGDTVLVSGELGSGKTTLIRGACRALGVSEPVTSPTFTIGQRYRGAVPVSHLDLFRLGAAGEGAGEAAAAEVPGLLDEYAEPPAVVFAEWPEAAMPLLPEPPVPGARTLRVSIRHEGGDRRLIEAGEVSPRGAER